MSPSHDTAVKEPGSNSPTHLFLDFLDILPWIGIERGQGQTMHSYLRWCADTTDLVNAIGGTDINQHPDVRERNTKVGGVQRVPGATLLSLTDTVNLRSPDDGLVGTSV